MAYEGDPSQTPVYEPEASSKSKPRKRLVKKGGGDSDEEEESRAKRMKKGKEVIGANSEDDNEGQRNMDDDPSDPSPSHHPQAEEGEGNEIDQLFKVCKKNNKNETSPAEIAMVVELEITAQEDADLNRQGKKVALLTEVLSSKKQLQQDFLDHGDTFWTACLTCRLLHQFERRYLGHQLVCPSCNKSFEALQVEGGDNGAVVRSSVRLRKMKASADGNVESDGSGDSRRRRLRKRMSSVGEVLERCEIKKPKVDEEIMTLAELQMEIKRKTQEEKMKLKDKDTREKDKDRQSKGKSSQVERCTVLKKGKDVESGKSRKRQGTKSDDLEEADDSQFYDFKKDKRSFKKGQVWAIYDDDDDDGMPRNYGLVDQVVSVSPFEVKISWLDLQNNGDHWLASCGRFKVARQITANSVHIFSHLVDCDRAAMEIYRIYPNKGSVWALYNEAAFEADGRNLLVKEKRCYDIVVFLTRYSEMHGLSMGYLEKVDGFKTVFKRREIGAHAIQCLEKDDVRLMSHEIPAKKLSGNEAPNLPKDCWELDPASLSLDLLTFG